MSNIFVYLFSFLLLIIFSNFSSSEDFGSLPPFKISDSEIFALVDKLRINDTNKAKPGYIQLNFQGHTTSRDPEDQASSRF